MSGSCREAIVLCGGLGTRLRSVSGDTPKSMVDVGGRPFLEILLGDLVRSGLQRVILATGYGHDVINARFGASWGGMEVVYSREREALGTGGAIAQALALASDDQVLAGNGDTYFEVDVAALARLRASENAHVTMALKPLTNFDRYGTVTLEGTRVTSFHEKRPTAAGVINGGVYVMRRDLFAGDDLPKAFSFERDWLERHVTNRRICGLVQDGYFVDIGVPADYERACQYFRTQDPQTARTDS